MTDVAFKKYHITDDYKYYYLFLGDVFVGYQIEGVDKSLYTGLDWKFWRDYKSSIAFDYAKQVDRVHMREVLTRSMSLA